MKIQYASQHALVAPSRIKSFIVPMSTCSHRGAPCSAQPAGELDVLLLDGNAFRVYGAQVRVVEDAHKEGFSGLLQRLDGLTLPSVGAAFVSCVLADLPYLEQTVNNARRTQTDFLPIAGRARATTVGPSSFGTCESPSRRQFLACTGAFSAPAQDPADLLRNR
jgi:hypothetical protein